MEQDKLLILLSRQLKDILVQAEKVLAGDNSAESIEGISKYSKELKEFIISKIPSPEIIKIAEEIPSINYKRNRIQFWQYLLFPIWWIAAYKDYHLRQVSIEEVNTAKGKFSSLLLLVNSSLN